MPDNCTKIDTCEKLEMVLEKDLLVSQYIESMRAICCKCKEPCNEVK